MSFFGFDATLPERRRGLDDDLDAFGDKAGAEDIAVYTWGTEDYDGLGDQLQEQGDDANDMTFGGGDIGEFGGRHCFESVGSTCGMLISILIDRVESSSQAPTSSLLSRRPSTPGWTTEDTNRTKLPLRTVPSRNSSLQSLRPTCLPAPKPTFSVRPRSVSSRPRSRAIRRPERFDRHLIDLPLAASRLRQKETSSRNVPTTSSFHSSGNSTPTNSTLNVIAQQATNPAPAYKTLEEIEAEARAAYARPSSGFMASAANQGSSGVQAPTNAAQPGDRPMTLEEIEREMMSNLTKSASPAPVPATSARQMQQPQHEMPSGLPQGYVQHLYQGQPQAQIQSPVVAPANVPQQARPPASDLTGIELLQKQLGNLAMFPPLGSAAPAKGQPKSEEQMDRELEARIRETEMAEMKRMRKANKIASMSRYNDVMTGGAQLGVLCMWYGLWLIELYTFAGDKEFITRIQLSQLVTQDPYTSDFYAQVHSAITRARLAAVGQPVGRGPADGPTVLQVGPDGRGLGVGVVRSTGGPKRLKETAMQRMTVQVKRIVENAQKRATAAPSG
jgi:DNA topoisomerase 2-associated protein PAT1